MDPIESVSRFLAWFATSKSMDIDDCLLERMSVLCCEYCVENAPDAGWQALEASELSANSLHDVEVDLAPWVAKLGVLAPVPAREQVDRWCTRDVDGFACWPETSPAAARLLARLYGLGGLRLEPKAPALCELAEHRFLGHRSLGQGSRLLLSDHEEGPVTE